MREEDLPTHLKAKIEAYCAHIAGGDAPPEVREELRGHFLDRVLGYLNGDDKLSPDDAYVLAREHFGPAADVRGSLYTAHADAVVPALFRRMAAGALLMIAAQFASAPIGQAVLYLYNLRDSGWGYIIFNLQGVVATLIIVGVSFYWMRLLRRGEAPWFMRWRSDTLIVLLIVVYSVVAGITLAGEKGGFPAPDYTNPLASIVAGLAPVLLVLQGCIWFWWCAIPPRSPRVFFFAVLGLALYGLPLSVMVTLSGEDSVAQQGIVGTLLKALLYGLLSLPNFLILSLVIGGIYLLLRRVAQWALASNAQI